MSPYRDQIAAALEAVAVRSASVFTWFGEASPGLSRAVTATQPRDFPRAYLLDQLQAVLYDSFYCRGRPTPHRSGDEPPSRPDAAFIDALSTANAGHGGWDPGWLVEAFEGPLVRVARDGLRMVVSPAECRPLGATAGAPINVRRRKEHLRLSPWFYFAFGDQLDTGAAIETRIYLNVTAAGAVPLVAVATRLLNRAGIPFSLKVLNHPASFTRCDAAVLYVRHGDFDRAREALRAIASACGPFLRPDAPAFTRPLRQGIAVAEHVSSHGVSFGSSRCRLLAECIVDAHERGATTLPARLDVVAHRFAARGLDFDAPYLAPGSSDGYVL